MLRDCKKQEYASAFEHLSSLSLRHTLALDVRTGTASQSLCKRVLQTEERRCNRWAGV